MKGVRVPLPAASALCEEIRDEGYGRDPLGPRLDCWGCLQAGGGNPVVAPARAANCARVVRRYQELVGSGKIGWL